MLFFSAALLHISACTHSQTSKLASTTTSLCCCCLTKAVGGFSHTLLKGTLRVVAEGRKNIMYPLTACLDPSWLKESNQLSSQCRSGFVLFFLDRGETYAHLAVRAEMRNKHPKNCCRCTAGVGDSDVRKQHGRIITISL